MISKRQDYSDLLEKLKFVSENYSINANGVVIDKNNKEINDEGILTCINFYGLYSIAYKKMIEILENIKFKDDKQIISYALLKNGVFNSFINNCIRELNMYGKIGTGYISYIPYNNLADYIFESERRKKILYDYINLEMKDYIDDKIKTLSKAR